MARRVYVVGVGMTKVSNFKFKLDICNKLFSFQFEKPGKTDKDYPDLAKEAVTKALNDSSLTIHDVKQACVGYVYGKYSFNTLKVIF